MTKYWDWMALQFGADGSVLMHPSVAAYAGDVAYHKIEPYFASMGLLFAYRATPELASAAAKAWVNWWFSRRDSDTGSAHVHYCTLDRASVVTELPDATPSVPSNHEDATDSNIALWFALLNEITQREGIDWLGYDVRGALPQVLNALVDLVDPADGLTWARKDYKVKYLMDNCEVYAGLRAAASMLRRVSSPLHFMADALAEKIGLSLLEYRDDTTGTWHTAKTDSGAFVPAVLTNSYPDCNAQVWPMLFAEDERSGLNTVAVLHGWTNGRIGSTTADVHLCLAAHQQQEKRNVQRWLQNVAGTYENGNSFGSDFTIAEAGQLHYITA